MISIQPIWANAAFFPSVYREMEIVTAVIRIVLVFLVYIEIITWLLTYHLSYYCLSCRIKAIRTLINGKNNQEMSSIRSLRTCAYLFDKISLAANELKTTFSLSILFILTLQLIVCTSNLFFSLYSYSFAIVPERMYVFLSHFLFSVITILVIVTTAELPISEVYLHSLNELNDFVYF